MIPRNGAYHRDKNLHLSKFILILHFKEDVFVKNHRFFRRFYLVKLKLSLKVGFEVGVRFG